MTVYVDDMRIPFGRMLMCHMLADTTTELKQMATKIGVSHKWIQKPGEYDEHFDVSLTKRRLAIEHGAKEIDWHELAELLRDKRLMLKAEAEREKSIEAESVTTPSENDPTTR